MAQSELVEAKKSPVVRRGSSKGPSKGADSDSLKDLFNDIPKLGELAAQIRESGSVTLDQLNAALPENVSADQIDDLIGVLESRGITVTRDNEVGDNGGKPAAQAEEGIRICGEIVEQVRDIPGVAGLHIMAVHWAESVPEIVTRAGLYPRPDAKTQLPTTAGKRTPAR